MTESFENLFSEASGKNWTLNLETNTGLGDLLKFNECVDVYGANGVRGVDALYTNLITKDGQWNYHLSNLSDGGQLFQLCSYLISFNVDLPSLTDGEAMFQRTSLVSFDSDLSNLTNGRSMFHRTGLSSFNVDLPSLTNGEHMFYECLWLKSFDSDLPSLTNGFGMFHKSALTSFDSDLSSLTDGYDMFDGCKLNTVSVQNIADTINTVSSGTIHIGIGNSAPNAEEETAFNTIASKGWTVYVNGSSWTSTDSTSTTNLTEEEQSTSIPFYAKPIQVTEDEAEYVDANNNYYNIVGAQFIYGDDLSTYGQFTSFEHAESEITIGLGLTKYIKPTEEENQ